MNFVLCSLNFLSKSFLNSLSGTLSILLVLFCTLSNKPSFHLAKREAFGLAELLLAVEPIDI